MKRSGSTDPGEDRGTDAWDIPGMIGAELAQHVAPALEFVQRLQAAGCITPSESRALDEAAGHLQRIAQTSQHITRLANQRLRHSHERLELADVLRHVLAENGRRFAQRGIVVEPHLQDIAVIMDAGLLVTLCEAALECAACDGERLQVWVNMKHWPEHGVLTIRARPHFREAGPESNAVRLQWIYLRRLAETTGVVVTRDRQADFVQITVEFPRTVKQLAGLTAMEVDTGGDAGTSSFAGHHVLMICRDEAIAWEVDMIARDMRLVLDVVGDCGNAVRFCELEMPDMIVVDERARDGRFDELRHDILRQNINFPCLEIVEAANVVEVGTWHGATISRLSRSELRAHLQPLLAMELAKVL